MSNNTINWAEILEHGLRPPGRSWPNIIYYFVEVYPGKFARLVRRGRTYHQFATMFEARMFAAGSRNSAKYLGPGYLNHNSLFVKLPEVITPEDLADPMF